MQATLFVTVLAALAAVVVGQAPVPTGFDFWYTNASYTVTQHGRVQQYNALHWCDRQNLVERFEQGDTTTSTGTLRRFDRPTKIVCATNHRQDATQCRCRNAPASSVVDEAFNWLALAETKYSGEATIDGQVCNVFENPRVVHTNVDAKLYVLKTDNKTPVQMETITRGDTRTTTLIKFQGFKFDRPHMVVFAIPKECNVTRLDDGNW